MITLFCSNYDFGRSILNMLQVFQWFFRHANEKTVALINMWGYIGMYDTFCLFYHKDSLILFIWNKWYHADLQIRVICFSSVMLVSNWASRLFNESLGVQHTDQWWLKFSSKMIGSFLIFIIEVGTEDRSLRNITWLCLFFRSFPFYGNELPSCSKVRLQPCMCISFGLIVLWQLTQKNTVIYSIKCCQ